MQGSTSTTPITRPTRRTRRKWALVVPVAAAALCCSAAPALADTSGTNTATLNVAPPPVVSITVSPTASTFGNCVTENGAPSSALVIPLGVCSVGQVVEGAVVGGITITNGSAPAEIEVNGAAAEPSDGGTPWALSNNGGSNANVFGESVWSVLDQGSTNIQPTATCDIAFAGQGCSAAAGASQTEQLYVGAPTSSTDTSPTWTITTTWTAISA
ncbi:MAG TPA: hypothetical protein VME46_00130 [Acidimicrobiales bacterium]|nr:hypothetical protein [Acidimicrobiales bacterium]